MASYYGGNIHDHLDWPESVFFYLVLNILVTMSMASWTVTRVSRSLKIVISGVILESLLLNIIVILMFIAIVQLGLGLS